MSNRSRVKQKIIDENLIPYKCSICKIDEWMENPLSLHLDHINGVRDDHRIENLRFLCPNCHSQTETYCGKKNGTKFNKNHKKVSDEVLVKSLSESDHIAEALKKVGLAGANNYPRAKKLAQKHGLHRVLRRIKFL